MKADPIGWPWLRTPAATRLIDRLWPEEVAEQRRQETNDEVYKRAVANFFGVDRQDARKEA